MRARLNIFRGSCIVIPALAAPRPVRTFFRRKAVISLEGWKDGFVITVDGLRVLRHCSSSPALFLGKAKNKGAKESEEAAREEGVSWRKLRACAMLKKGANQASLRFGDVFTVQITYKDHLLRLRPSAAEDRCSFKIRFDARPGEKLFGAGPSELYNLKGKKLKISQTDDALSRKSPVIFSDSGQWIALKGGGDLSWRFAASSTRLVCAALPEEIALGFEAAPTAGVELLSRYGAENQGGGKKRAGESSRARAALPESWLSGLILDMRGFPGRQADAFNALSRAGIKAQAAIADKKDMSGFPEGFCAIAEGEWTSSLALAAARSLSPESLNIKSAACLTRAILSLSLSGTGHVFWPMGDNELSGEKGAGSAARALELAVFSPLFVIKAPFWPLEERAARRLAAASLFYGLLEPYRRACAKVWLDQGLPALAHPALYYPATPELWGLDDQYMYGSDMLIAPAVGGEKNIRRLRLPDDEWIHLWTSRRYLKGRHFVETPRGRPAVFYRERSAFAGLFDELRRKAARL